MMQCKAALALFYVIMSVIIQMRIRQSCVISLMCSSWPYLNDLRDTFDVLFLTLQVQSFYQTR